LGRYNISAIYELALKSKVKVPIGFPLDSSG